LLPNTGVGFGYVYHRHANIRHGSRERRAADDVWTVPVVLRDPFDGQSVTLYTYPSSYAGAAFNQNKVLNAARSVR
jgi:hypothetical protein